MAEKLRRELSDKVPGVTTSLLTNKKVLHIKDMDEVTTVEEIKKEISKATGSDVDKLIQNRSIKIGWTSCRILERVNETRCFRCWEMGHLKEQCKGPDREKLCLKCGKEGHKAADCRNKPFCLQNGAEGH